MSISESSTRRSTPRAWMQTAFRYLLATPGSTTQRNCAGATLHEPRPSTRHRSSTNPALQFIAGLLRPDHGRLHRPTDGCAGTTSGLYPFHGHTDVKELALYLQDAITKGNWSLNLGLRGDFYNGLVVARQAEPRLGVAYNIKRTNTVLRVSYARTLESPFNENLVLSSTGCVMQS